MNQTSQLNVEDSYLFHNPQTSFHNPLKFGHKLHVRDFDAYPNLYSGCDILAYIGDSAHPLRPTGGGCNIGTGRCMDDWQIGIRPTIHRER